MAGLCYSPAFENHDVSVLVPSTIVLVAAFAIVFAINSSIHRSAPLTPLTHSPPMETELGEP